MSDVAGVRWVFFLQPLVMGAWFPRIPQVQAALGLSEGELAFALVGMPLGLLFALSFGGRLGEALGTRRLLVGGLLLHLVLMPLPAFAGSGPALFLALVAAGVGLAGAELGLNVSAAEVETRSGRSIMNGAHGCWSIGVLVGSALGAFQAEMGLAPHLSLTGIAVVAALPTFWVARSITDFEVHAPETQGNGRRRLSRALLFVSVFAFGIAMTEGAMADWAAVYMTQSFDVTPGMAGAAFTVFALFVALGRFSGDALKARIPTPFLAGGFVVIALLGLGLVVLSPTVIGGYAGIGLLGLGVSLGFPLAVSAASGLPGRSSAGNVAILTQITLCGFLVGPVVIGLVAEASSIRYGLAALAPVLVLSLVMARHVHGAGSEDQG